MKQISQIAFGLLTLLLACKVDKSKPTDNFPIPDPRLVDFDPPDSMLRRATRKVRDYLTIKENNVDIKDFYLDSAYIKADTVILMINHVDYYKEWRLMKEDEKRQKELKAKGDTIKEILWVPPTGNWSGRDRTILYLIKKDSIIDILYQ